MTSSGRVHNVANGEWRERQYRVGEQEGTVHPPTDRVDLYVDTLCHVECTIVHDGHIQLLTVLPHTTFQLPCVMSHHMHVQIDVVGL
jgi:hypothetical protein